MGAESTIFTPNVTVGDAIADLIEGGAIRGENLLQSFSEFNIPEGGRLFFANLDGINNIFTRVTGGNSSNILGALGVDGNANLFLLNPQGIIFGDVVITTGNSWQIQDEGEIAIAVNELGFSGNISIEGDNISLQDAGRISNQSSNGSEGNIDIEADTLFLSDRSAITTNANQNVTGGNITLDIDDTPVSSGSS